MNDIEKRARELLAAEWAADGWDEIGRQVTGEHQLSESPSLRAIIAALTPPEGYVLVPEDILRPLLRDAITAVEFVGGRAQSKPLSRRISERAWKLVEACPARPRVNRG